MPDAAPIEIAPAMRKAVLQALIHDIRVTGRDHVRPVFRIPIRIEDPVGDGGA